MISIDRPQPCRRALTVPLIPALLCLLWSSAAGAACSGGGSPDDETLIDLALAEALKSDVVSDLPVEDLTVDVRSVGDVWEVTFQDPDWDPNMLGDTGFLVRLGKPCGHLLELLRYQ